MQRIVILSLTIVLACLVSSCSCKLRLSDEYLDVRGQEKFPPSSFVSVLKKLDLKSVASQTDIPKVMRKLSDASDEKEEFLKDTLGHLIGLSEDKDECSRKMVPAFVMSVNGIDELRRDGNDEGVNFLESYLIENGRRRFAKCAISTISELVESLTTRRAKEDLDLVDLTLRRGLSMPKRFTLEELYEKLKGYHPARDKTDVGKLIHDSVAFRGVDPGERTLNLYKVTCELFWMRFENSMDILNVARILNPNWDFFKGNVRLLAMNERNRVCIEIHQNSAAFLDQLRKKTKWYHELVVEF